MIVCTNMPSRWPHEAGWHAGREGRECVIPEHYTVQQAALYVAGFYEGRERAAAANARAEARLGC